MRSQRHSSTGAGSAPQVPASSESLAMPRVGGSPTPVVPELNPTQMMKLVTSFGGGVFSLEDRPVVLGVLLKLVEWSNQSQGPIQLSVEERDHLAVASKIIGQVVEDHIKMQESRPVRGSPSPIVRLTQEQQKFKGIVERAGLTAGAECLLVDLSGNRHPSRIIHVSYENGHVAVSLASNSKQHRVPAFRLENSVGKPLIEASAWAKLGYTEQSR